MKQIPKPEDKNPRIGQLNAKREEEVVKRSSDIVELAVVRERRKLDNYGHAGENGVRKLLGQTSLPDAGSDEAREGELLKLIHESNNTISAYDRAIRNERSIGARLVLEDTEIKDAIYKSGNAISKDVIEIHSKSLERDKMLDALEDVGCDVGHYRIHLNGLSGPRDLSGGFWYSMRDLIDAGYMSKRDLPKVFQ